MRAVRGDSRTMAAKCRELLLDLIGLLVFERHVDQRARIPLRQRLQFAPLPSSPRNDWNNFARISGFILELTKAAGALHRHGRRHLAQLLLRGALGGSQFAARGLLDLFDFGLARSAQAVPIPRPNFVAPPRAFPRLPDRAARSLLPPSLQLAIRLRLVRRGFMNARRNGLGVAAEKRAAVFRDQIGDAAENDQEIEPAKYQPRGGIGGIGFGAFGGKRGKRREKGNQQHA